MPVTVEKLPGEPIIIATHTGETTAEEVAIMFARSAELMRGIDGTVYRITDVTGVTLSLPNLLGIVGEASRRGPGSPGDPRLRVHMVGTDAMAKLYVEFVKHRRNGGVQIPMHRTVDAALHAIRLQITAERKAV